MTGFIRSQSRSLAKTTSPASSDSVKTTTQLCTAVQYSSAAVQQCRGEPVSISISPNRWPAASGVVVSGELSSISLSHTVVVSIYVVDAGKEELGEQGERGSGSSFLILVEETLAGVDIVVIDDEHKSFSLYRTRTL